MMNIPRIMEVSGVDDFAGAGDGTAVLVIGGNGSIPICWR